MHSYVIRLIIFQIRNLLSIIILHLQLDDKPIIATNPLFEKIIFYVTPLYIPTIRIDSDKYMGNVFEHPTTEIFHRERVYRISYRTMHAIANRLAKNSAELYSAGPNVFSSIELEV